MAPVDGTCDARFAAVGDVFRDNFERGELGAGCTVVVDGRVVVDVWGGWADGSQRRPWARDTLVNAYSVGKPVVALAVLELVGAGDLDLDAPASTVWPELRAGQLGATVRHVLSHQAGVPAIRTPMTDADLVDWRTMTDAIAATAPWWPPGAGLAYHTNTYGFLCGELARRVTGWEPREWLARRVAGRLGADLHWGLGATDQRRCAEVDWVGGTSLSIDWSTLDGLPTEQAMVLLGYANPPGFSSMGIVNTPAWRAAQVPSTNLHATAAGVATLYAALAAGGALDGVRVVDAAVLAEATTTQAEGWCPVLQRDASFGLGFQPTRPDRPFGPNPGSFGHFGTGGALGFADPAAGVAFGYVMNRVVPRWQNDRNRALVDAVYSCL